MIRAYHRARGDLERTEVLVPDSSHGTNPATATHGRLPDRHGPVGTRRRGRHRGASGPPSGRDTAAVMITNPSTLGLFEQRIGELLTAVHEVGALAYMDGANLNAILGRFKPGEAGFDVMHFNVHKTFSTPHGGGGPGAGPVGVREALLPVPARRRGSCARRTARSGSSGTGSGRRASAGCAASSATSGCSSGPRRTSRPTATAACAR